MQCRASGTTPRLRLRYRSPLPPGARTMMKLVSAWFRIPFWQRVAAGFVLGALAGWLFGPAADTWFKPLGDVYVTLIKMIAALRFAVRGAFGAQAHSRPRRTPALATRGKVGNIGGDSGWTRRRDSASQVGCTRHRIRAPLAA
jgi:hypothetical protein